MSAFLMRPGRFGGEVDPVPDYISKWTFDDSKTTSTVATDSAGSHNIALTHAPISADGTIGESRDFDGTNDYGTLTEHADFDWVTASTATLAVWINSDVAYSNAMGIFTKYTADGNRQYLLNTQDGNIAFAGYNGFPRDIFIASGALSLGTWYHIVVTLDAGDAELFVDASSVGTDSGLMQTITAPTQVAWWNRNSSDRRFDGKLDDMRVYDRVLTGTEITALYDLGA